MRFGVAIAVAVVATACMAMVPSCKARTRLLVDNAQISDTKVHQVGRGPQGNASEPAARCVSQAAPMTASGRSPNVSSVATICSIATKSMSSIGHVPSTAKVTPLPMTTSTVWNISAGTTVPSPVTVPKPGKVSPAPATPQSTRPLKGMNSTNAQRLTNVSTLPTISRHPESPTKLPQARKVPQGAGTQQAPSPQEDENTQQNPASVEAVTGVIHSSDRLTGIYTNIPGVFDDAAVEAPQNKTRGLQNPLEKFRMCTLITRVGDERGPITVLVAAEDEQRMQAAGSFYHVGSVYPEKQRAFTSFCPGRADLYLTFNPSKRQ